MRSSNAARAARLLSFAAVTVLIGSSALGQDPVKTDRTPESAPAEPRTVTWKEGVPVVVRIPVAVADAKRMAMISLPEDGIQSAVSGFTKKDISVDVRGGLLFLRLLAETRGEMTLIGTSGAAYLLSIEPAKGADYDRFVKILRPEASAARTEPERRRQGKPAGALGLIRAMRIGARPEGVRIFKADRELLLQTPEIEVRLAYVYRLAPYVGRVYEVRNRTSQRLSFDAARFRPKPGGGEKLILSGLKENLLPSNETTFLYIVFWSNR